VVTVRLLRFRGAENAAYYLRGSLDGGVVGMDVQQRAVVGIAGGRSIISTAPVNGEGSAYVTLSAATAGDVAVVVAVAAADREAAPVELTERLLAEAYARL
jgi:hypothetical protein